jgi:arsenate reductase (thioredoxin)
VKSTLPVFLAVTIVSVCAFGQDGRELLNPKVASCIKSAVNEFDQIPDDRKKALEKVALYVQSRIAAGQEARLIFICSHNSRRSHLSQVWAQAAACYYGVPMTKTFSGGTEATACNPRTVATLQRAGFEIKKTSGGDDKNPVYEITYAQSQEPIKAFSKVYSDAPNPSSDFCAIMNCDTADKNCPVVKGCSLRVPILYVDPKSSDDTPQEAATYDERCHQICREMSYLFGKITPSKARG